MGAPKSSRSKVKRVPQRGHYDRETINKILDAGFVGHVGFVIDDQPFVIPMAYGRLQDHVYLHGATSSRLISNLKEGLPICLTVTHLDGIVLARSAFHHSMNYRSVVLFGTAHEVPSTEKEKALEVISEQILKGRWNSSRKPNSKELKATTVLKLTIEEASAKIRTGPPKDDKPDYKLPIWAGVIPIVSNILPVEPDPELMPGVEPGPEIKALYEKEF